MKNLIIILFLCLITVTSCGKATEVFYIDLNVVFVNETYHTITLYNTGYNSIPYPDFTLIGLSSFTIEGKERNIDAYVIAPKEAEVIIDEEISVHFEYKPDDRDPYNPCLDRNFEQICPTKYLDIHTFTFTEEAVEYYINLAKEQQGEEEQSE